MTIPDYSHFLEFDEDRRVLRVERVFPDGRRQLFTETSLPDKNAIYSEEGFQAFCRVLGENIILDSPVARRIFKL